MKQPLFIRLDPEQIEQVKSQPNQSVYIQELIKKDQHRETRQKYVFNMIGEMVLIDINRMPETELISRLSMLLSQAITGTDVLPQIQGRIEL